MEKEIDHRYLPWLVGLLSNKRFPEHVKILSWNYDFQLQIAGQYFGELEKVAHTTNASHYQPGFINYFPNLDYSPSDVYSLIHLNGIAGYETSSSVFHSADREQVVNQLLSDTATYHNAIHFAWDGSRYHDTLMKDVIKMIDGVTILVVIGYSFPFYNRKVDAGIFKSIHTHGKLKKIYYQDPYLTGSQLPAMFSLPESLNIVHIKNKDNFHIPFEY